MWFLNQVDSSKSWEFERKHWISPRGSKDHSPNMGEFWQTLAKKSESVLAMFHVRAQ